ncbi:hypothetical protein [Acanthopleuribacter pedis]|uniref:Uncharacterized protein n=1 Tax=Acanthopleuribacter pedis TaxID=442870 RepID=A0A8J7Q3B9_9BACT|nr:hypothetical protein [Acanthopleuribacter pedis]MBO1316846.1 hypothetical protein [Acanthopleuribacter pedis]
MKRWFWLVCFAVPAWLCGQVPAGVASAQAHHRALPETEAAFTELLRGLESCVARFNAGERPPGLASLSPELEVLAAAVETEAAVAVPRFSGDESSLDVNGSVFFKAYPVLPPEIKDGDNWRFETIRFEVVPKNMFIFALTFKASRTIRLKKVTLVFRDGRRMVHDAWADLENGNGRPFRKRLYLPWLDAFERGEIRVARPLAAVEIEGSAQDAGFEALLDFRVKIPDIEAAPHQETRELVVRMRREWARRPLNAEALNQSLQEMARLSVYLSIPFTPRTALSVDP